MTGRAGQPPGAPDATRYVLIPDAQASRQADIIELILADHRRIGRLCRALHDAARYDDGPRPDWMLGHVWQRLADLLVAHTRAEEETCYLTLLGPGGQAAERMRDSIADHDDIRGTISEAAGQPVGSAAWWHTARTVMAVSAEHLEHEERDVLPVWLPGLTMSRRKELGRQWCAFVAAWRPDATFAQPQRRSSSGPHRLPGIPATRKGHPDPLTINCGRKPMETYLVTDRKRDFPARTAGRPGDVMNESAWAADRTADIPREKGTAVSAKDAKDKAKDKAEATKGKLKKGAGKAVGSPTLEAKGKAKQAKGNLKQAGKKAKDAAKK